MKHANFLFMVFVLLASCAPRNISQPTAATPTGGGSKIAFSSNRDGNYEIYTMDSDGRNPKRLTNSPAEDWYPEIYNRTDAYLLYWSYRPADPVKATLNWLSMDGSKQGVSADNVGGISDASPIGLIAMEIFSTYGTYDIGVVPGGGGDVVRLTDDPKNDVHPSWSPDGQSIAFASDRDGVYRIYVMNRDGTNQRRLTSSDVVEIEPDWSPDGSMIAFVSGDNIQTNIYIMKADGASLDQITFETDNFNENPVWSPDGTMLAFWSNRTGNSEIYSIKIDGTGLINLTNHPGEDQNPSW